MGFSEEAIAALRGNSAPEIAVLLNAALPESGAPPARREIQPERLFDLARLNKMLGWLPMGAADLPPGCAGLAPRLLQVRLQTMSMNRRTVAVTREASLALTSAGIRHVVMKGPFQQIAVHGNPFQRPSGDSDFYVAPRDRKRAGAVLESLGFAAMEADQALWWVSFLGEQHFQRDRDEAVIDLHHQLQQVGLPAWRAGEAVLERAVMLDHEGARIPMLSAEDGCLLMCGTLAKAMLAHEPCGWAVVDLIHWLRQLTPAQSTALSRRAAASGQDRTLSLGITLAQAFDQDAGSLGSPLRGLKTDPAYLRDLVFQPWERRADAPRRRHMLQMLSQGRPHVFAYEAAKAALASRVQGVLARRAERAR